ncbi:hypothetical protein [Microbacterium resistens]|nr:hypothetical protein [Streptomyces sp. MS2A]
MSTPAPLEPWIGQFLHRVGIETPDPEVQLHRRLVSALRDVGPGRPLGAQIAAVRYVVRDEHGRAGRALAAARADHEDTVRDRKIELLQGDEKITVALAKELAEQDAAKHRREWLRAEQEERTLREFLKALADDLDNHQTDRADQRAGDRAEAHGIGGGA